MTKSEAAMRVMGNLGGNHPPELNPILTAIIVRIIALIIERCGEKIIDNFMKDPNWFSILTLRSLTKRAFKEDGMSRKQIKAEYAKNGEEILKAILKTAKESTKKEITDLVRSHQGNQ